MKTLHVQPPYSYQGVMFLNVKNMYIMAVLI